MAKPDEWTGIDYKFNEGELTRELAEYIDATYDGHYSKNKFQSTEFIVDCGCLLYTSPSPRDRTRSRMPSSA